MYKDFILILKIHPESIYDKILNIDEFVFFKLVFPE